jgi:uncharacterized protein
MKIKDFYKDGLNFKCQGSGKCCVSRGEYGYVYVTKDDIKNLADRQQLSAREFKSRFCKVTDGVAHLIQPKETEDCIFLRDKRCTVYEARPVQCRTWPFWPENMNSKAWKRDVIAFCPGASVKSKKSADVIHAQVLEQADSEKELFGV